MELEAGGTSLFVVAGEEVWVSIVLEVVGRVWVAIVLEVVGRVWVATVLYFFSGGVGVSISELLILRPIGVLMKMSKVVWWGLHLFAD